MLHIACTQIGVKGHVGVTRGHFVIFFKMLLLLHLTCNNDETCTQVGASTCVYVVFSDKGQRSHKGHDGQKQGQILNQPYL